MTQNFLTVRKTRLWNTTLILAGLESDKRVKKTILLKHRCITYNTLYATLHNILYVIPATPQLLKTARY